MPSNLNGFRLKQELSELQICAERQKRKLKKQAIFKEFLEKVLEQSPEVCGLAVHTLELILSYLCYRSIYVRT